MVRKDNRQENINMGTAIGKSENNLLQNGIYLREHGHVGKCFVDIGCAHVVLLVQETEGFMGARDPLLEALLALEDGEVVVQPRSQLVQHVFVARLVRERQIEVPHDEVSADGRHSI